jgi:hypothetical protein
MISFALYGSFLCQVYLLSLGYHTLRLTPREYWGEWNEKLDLLEFMVDSRPGFSRWFSLNFHNEVFAV